MPDGKVIIDTELNKTGVEKGMQSLNNSVTNFQGVASSAFKTAGTVLVGFGTACVGVGGSIYALANSTATAGDTVDKMSQKIGVTTDYYQEMSYVMDLCGTDVNNLQTGMKTLSGVITEAGNGSSGAAEKLAALGLSFDDLKGKSQQEQLDMVIQKLQGMGEGAQRTKTATDLLGRSATELGPLLNISAQEMDKMKDTAHKYGMVMSKEAVKESARFKDSMTTLKGSITGLKNNIVAQALPALSDFADAFTALINGEVGAKEKLHEATQDIIRNIKSVVHDLKPIIVEGIKALIEVVPELVMEVAGAVVDAMPAFIKVIGIGFAAFKSYEIVGTVSDLISKFTKATTGATIATGAQAVATEGATGAQVSLNAAMAANPVGLIVAGIVALIGGLVAFAKQVEADSPAYQLKEQFDDLNDEIEDTKTKFEDQNKSIQNNGKHANDLVGKIKKLQGQTKLTADEQKNMAKYVKELNTLYPDLNVTIDENTGKIQGNVDAIYDQIQAEKDRLEEEMRQEEAEELLRQQIELENQLAESKRQLIALAEWENTTVEELMENKNLWYSGANEQYIENYNDISAALEENKKKYDDVTEASANYAEKQEEVQKQIDATRETMVKLGDQTVIVKGLTAENEEKVIELADAYNKAYDEAYESAMKQGGLWDELEKKTGISVANMAKNLKDNAQNMTDYANNMKLLAKAVDQGLLESGIYEELEALGVDGAAQVQNLADSFEYTYVGTVTYASGAREGILDLNESMRGYQESAKNVAEVQTKDLKESFYSFIGYNEEAGGSADEFAEKVTESFGETMEVIEAFGQTLEESGVEIVDTAMQAMADEINTLPSTFQTAGQNVIEGLWNGMNDKKGWLLERVSSLADSIVKQLKSDLQIKSPSRVMRDEVGHWIAEGIVVGFEEDMPAKQISDSLTSGLGDIGSRIDFTGGMLGGAGGYTQIINVNQEVSTPDELARIMRTESRYPILGGLA